jgi:hypothetical protein
MLQEAMRRGAVVGRNRRNEREELAFGIRKNVAMR